VSNTLTQALSFSDFLRERVGPNWVLAQRLTPSLRARGYVTAVSPRAYAELEAEWERATFGARLEDLHAAAPDMLEALKRLVEDGDGISQREYARAAIAKAEGR
jgi:hypothetical protein